MAEVEVVKKKRKTVRELVKCPLCDYTCHGTQALGRHTRYKHSETLERDPKVSITARSLRGLLSVVDEGLASAGSRKITGKLGAAAQRQDLQIHLTLMAVAHSKALRAVQLEGFLDGIVRTLMGKLTAEVLENMNPASLLNLLERLNKTVSTDTEYLKGLLSIKDAGSRRFFLRVVEMIRSSSSNAGYLQETSEELFKVLDAECEGMSQSEADQFRRIIGDLGKREKLPSAGG